MKTEDLHALAFDVTSEVAIGYPHMMEVWRMMLGGFILPELAKAEPDVLSNEAYREMIKQYDKESIQSFFARAASGPIETERVVEVPVIVEKTVVLSGEKVTHRRIRDDVSKVSRKVRGLTTMERDVVITVFNTQQDMIDRTSKVFKSLVERFNEGHEEDDLISPSQLSGYWSSLCRWADSTPEDRNNWIRKQVARGVFRIEPIYTPEFIAKIKLNYTKAREEDESRRRDHALIKSGSRPTPTVVMSEVKPKPTELDTLLSLDLSDIS